MITADLMRPLENVPASVIDLGSVRLVLDFECPHCQGGRLQTKDKKCLDCAGKGVIPSREGVALLAFMKKYLHVTADRTAPETAAPSSIEKTDLRT